MANLNLVSCAKFMFSDEQTGDIHEGLEFAVVPWHLFLIHANTLIEYYKVYIWIIWKYFFIFFCHVRIFFFRFSCNFI